MPMPISTKLHILLILTVVGVSLYMFMLYKEVKLFEKDLAMMKIDMANLRLEKEVVTDRQKETKPKPKPVPVDDDVSITSNEIKDILTNIQQVDEDEPDEIRDEIHEEIHDEIHDEIHEKIIHEEDEDIKSIIETSISPNDCNFPNNCNFEMTEDQLNACKYDDLKVMLRKNGITIRGSKSELIKKILMLKKIDRV